MKVVLEITLVLLFGMGLCACISVAPLFKETVTSPNGDITVTKIVAPVRAFIRGKVSNEDYGVDYQASSTDADGATNSFRLKFGATRAKTESDVDVDNALRATGDAVGGAIRSMISPGLP